VPLFSRQFVNAKIIKNTVKIMVIGVKSRLSILFFEVMFPMVLNKNKKDIAQSIIVITFLWRLKFRTPACIKITNRKNEFMEIENISKRYISVSDFSLPPQTIL
jgi:hypothetical protein